MAEEHRFQAQEGHILCANNCGFFGSPATSNFCSKCFRDLRMEEEQDALAKSALEGNANANAKSCPASPIPKALTAIKLPEIASCAEVVSAAPAAEVASVTLQANRCVTCRKRIGLTGFKCRCGSVYCGPHRYPEQHGCSFDYKSKGKEEIAKANPVVKAAKLHKI